MNSGSKDVRWQMQAVDVVISDLLYISDAVTPHRGQKTITLGNFWYLGTPVPTPFYQWGPNLVCYSRPKVYTSRPNFMWMCSLCRIPVAKTTIFGKFWHFGGLLYGPPFTDEGQIWCAIADPRSTFTWEISCRLVYFVVLWLQKNPIFAVFWTSAFSDVANWHQSQKVEHGCTTTKLPLSNGIKIVSVLQRLHGEIGCTNSDIQKRDGQTNKWPLTQTDTLNNGICKLQLYIKLQLHYNTQI